MLITPDQSYSLTIAGTEIENIGAYFIELKGTIVKGDYDSLISLVKEHKKLPAWIKITSEGGSVTEAIKIGKFVREALIPVNAHDQCYSSCFYIWVSSVDRNVFSKDINYITDAISDIENFKVIGLHRPYFDKGYFSTLSMDEADIKYRELELGVRAFLKQMNVREKWIDEMMTHSSENILLVTRRKLDLEFGFTSHSFEEWIIAKCPTQERTLLLGKGLVLMDAMGHDDSNVKLTAEQKMEIKKQYLSYSSCKERAIRSTQAEVLDKLLK
ncbi:MAG: hypothetical protein JBO36_15480 [Candidatus Thiodiazotropha taylori]|nr:hypothetical protein [Candidatus Thiodiazotropha taylori]